MRMAFTEEVEHEYGQLQSYQSLNGQIHNTIRSTVRCHSWDDLILEMRYRGLCCGYCSVQGKETQSRLVTSREGGTALLTSTFCDDVYCMSNGLWEFLPPLMADHLQSSYGIQCPAVEQLNDIANDPGEWAGQVVDLQAGHSSHIAGMIYAPEPAGTLQPLWERFCMTSPDWHQFLAF